MDLNFAAILQGLGPNAAFRILNTARPAPDRLLNSILPEETRATYHVSSGSMTITATMAGLVAMDSPYPPGGAMAARSWQEQTAKVAQDIPLPEATIRELHALLQAYGGDGTDDRARQVVLNFVEKVINQAQLDTAEWMRGVALTTGKLQWTFNGIKLDVDYGVPSANLFAQRTGTAGYGGSASNFWADWVAGHAKLGNRVRARIASPATTNLIIANAANRLIVTAQDMVTGSASFVRRAVDAGTGQAFNVGDSDSRFSAQITGYGSQGAVLNPTTPGIPQAVPFLPDGVIVLIGDPIQGGFRVGSLGNDQPTENQLPLGYTHLAPTVEGGGVPGRWGDVIVPQDQPWMIRGRSAANLLPVIEAPDKLVVLSTAMS